MNFIPCKCPQCGGDLQIPSDKDIVRCMYCTADIKVRDVISIQASNPKNLEALANNAFEGGNYKEAEDYCNRILEIDPDNVEAWLKKGLSAGWRSNLARDNFSEMFASIDKGLSFCQNDADRAIHEMLYALHIFSLCHEYFQLSLNHTLKFISVHDAQYDHAERCRNIVLALERAHIFDPDIQEIPNLIVDISSRQINVRLVSDDLKYFFRQKIVEFTNEKTPPKLVEQSKAGGCFVITATMGDDRNIFVQNLRNFRDEVIVKSKIGNNFIEWYYEKGPKVASFISGSLFLRVVSFVFIVVPSFFVALFVLGVLGILRKASKLN